MKLIVPLLLIPFTEVKGVFFFSLEHSTSSWEYPAALIKMCAWYTGLRTQLQSCFSQESIQSQRDSCISRALDEGFSMQIRVIFTLRL